jgi:hypothetical protein
MHRQTDARGPNAEVARAYVVRRRAAPAARNAESKASLSERDRVTAFSVDQPPVALLLAEGVSRSKVIAIAKKDLLVTQKDERLPGSSSGRPNRVGCSAASGRSCAIGSLTYRS